MRRNLLLEAEMICVREEELRLDLLNDAEGVDRCKQRLDELLDQYGIPSQRQPSE